MGIPLFKLRLHANFSPVDGSFLCSDDFVDTVLNHLLPEGAWLNHPQTEW